jgi:dephospho-CoA kinase
MGAYAHLSLPEIRNLLTTYKQVLIDGLYSWSEYTLLEKEMPNQVALVVILSKRQNRYQRLATRPVRPLTEKQAQERDFAEIEKLEKGGPIALCDYYITNDGSIEDLKKQVSSVASELF